MKASYLAAIWIAVLSANGLLASDFTLSCPASPYPGLTTPLTAFPSGSASATLALAWVSGSSQTIQLSVSGLPAGASASFAPPMVTVPAGSGDSATATISIGAATPPGFYYLRFDATNQEAATHSILGALAVPETSSVQEVSVNSSSVQGNDGSLWTSISADGRFLSFFSTATNLVTGDTNNAGDVFVRDLAGNAAYRASIADDGSQANDWSTEPYISDNGRFVTFRSTATNLVPGPAPPAGNIYVRDTVLGRTVRASVAADGTASNDECFMPSVSADGRFVAFSSLATNLAAGAGGVSQVYVRDVAAGTTVAVSRATDGTLGDGYSASASISGDGRFVAFVSESSNLVPGATVNGRQLFVFDRATQTLELVSGAPGGGPANGALAVSGDERGSSITPDGRFVAFASYATNLDPAANDLNDAVDVFVRDRKSGTTQLVSVADDGTATGVPAGGTWPSLSADGRFVAFRVGLPTHEGLLVRRDRLLQRTVPSAGGASDRPLLVTGDAEVFLASSSNGRVASFSASAQDLIAGSTSTQPDVFAAFLPAEGPSFAQTVTFTPSSLRGGTAATLTVTLSAAAPAGGAAVSLTTPAAQMLIPPVITVPQGQTSASIAISTSAVAAELRTSVVASYGGGSPWALVTLTPGASPRGDFNGDGNSDIYWRSYATGAIAVWQMNGTAFSSIVNLPGLPTTAYRIEGIGDFNGDGQPDILWRNGTTGANALWLMNGATVSSIVDLPGLPGANFRFEGVADMDGDGKPDILIRNYANGNNAVWLMKGTTFSAIVNLPALPNPDYHIEAAADFDGDGKPDIVWRNYTTGANALWLMNGTSYVSTVNLDALPNSSYHIDAVADFNKDGHNDIVWRSYATGANALWVMDSSYHYTIVNLDALPDTNYELSGPR